MLNVLMRVQLKKISLEELTGQVTHDCSTNKQQEIKQTSKRIHV